MLFRATKKFFQKTVENFKSFLSGGYQRLPKNSPCNNFPCGCGGGGGETIHDHLKVINCSESYKELGHCNRESVRIDHREAKQGRIISKKKETPRPRTEEICRIEDRAAGKVDQKDQDQRKKKIVYEGKRFYQDYSRTGRVIKREKNTFLVAKKLRELELLDNGNVEHALDIEEVLHYYSLLTCEAYVDIVDQFFMDVYSEFLNGPGVGDFRPMLQRVGFYH